MIQRLINGAALAAVLVLAGCASLPPGRAPEGVIAEYASRVAKTISVTQSAVGALGTAPGVALPVREGSLKALQGMQKVNEYGVQLADVLKVIADVRAAGGEVPRTDLATALVLVANINDTVLLQVIPQLGSPEAQLALAAASEIAKLVLSIQLELGKLTPAEAN